MQPLIRAALAGLALVVPAQAQPTTAIPVGVVTAERRQVNGTLDFVGRVEAIERVEIRARVTGYLQAVLFKEGDRVKEGEKLFHIEPEPFQASVQQAQGALLRAQASTTNASQQLRRAEELVRTNAIAVAERDKRLADEKNAQGDSVTAEANLTTAKINLGYTDITAPISGVIGRSKLTKGNVVNPDAGVLAVIVSTDPIYVTFPVSQRQFLRLKSSEIRATGKALAVSLRFSDGSVYDKPGKIDFVDTTVDRGTDSVLVRAIIANPDGQLIDGQLVSVAVQDTNGDEKVLVPQSALIADQQGTYVFVAQDGKAAIRRIKTSSQSGANAVVESGLDGGENVITEGIEALRPGTPVTARPAAPGLKTPAPSGRS